MDYFVNFAKKNRLLSLVLSSLHCYLHDFVVTASLCRDFSLVSRIFSPSSITLAAREHENGLVSGDDPNGLKMVYPAASIHHTAQPTSAFWRITHLMI
jgi:hypothetical protein